MFVEIYYAFETNSLCLYADSFCMLFNASIYCMGIYASFVTRLEKEF